MTRTILERAVEENPARERRVVLTIPKGEARERLRRHVERNAREALAQLAQLKRPERADVVAGRPSDSPRAITR